MRIALLLLLVCSGALAQENQINLAVAPNATVTSLKEKQTQQEWLAPGKHPFASVKKAGKYYPASNLERDGDTWRLKFGAANIEVTCRVTSRAHYLIFQIERVHGDGLEELRLAELRVACKERSGALCATCWNDQFSVGLFGLSDSVNVQLPTKGSIVASFYPEFGVEGKGVALIAAPTSQYLDVIEEMERECGLPSPKLSGRWAKRSADVNRGYFFTDLTEDNADETIRYAKLGGFEYILTYDGTWSSSLGSYPINTKNFPHGEEGLKAVADKCHAAGLKIGLHCLTSFISKRDALVHPKPDARLMKDDEATLAGDIDAKATDFAATASVASFPVEGAYHGNEKSGFDIQIDDEIIQYRSLGDKTFVKCTRGFAGTTAQKHAAGAKIHHLVERYGSYLADLRTGLKGQISERLAGVVNRCGFDMIYFDGGECNSTNGPHWYWVSQQQDDICRRFNRDVLVQGSGVTQWTWHWFSRVVCDDFAAVAPKQYLDYHKIADSWRAGTNGFMPVELGWWGFLAATPAQPATTPDEVEYYAIRMLALDAPVSLETHLASLKANGRTEEMLQLLGQYEQLRVSGTVPASLREQLRAGEWHRIGSDFVPIRYEPVRLVGAEARQVNNSFAAQPLKFRLQATPALAAPGDKANIVLLNVDPPAELPPVTDKTLMPGGLCGRVEFAKSVGDQVSVFMVGQAGPAKTTQQGKSLNLLNHRALAITLRTEKPSTAVLNVQLEAAAKTYRDYYVDLNFAGEKTIVIPEPTTERMLPEFRPAPANYAFKAAMYGFRYEQIIALNLRWMRDPAPCRVVRVEALAESEASLKNPTLTIGGTAMTIPAELKTGDYIEWLASGPARVFDRDGVALTSVTPAGAAPVLQAGANEVRLTAAAPASAVLTVITTGEKLPMR